MDGASVTDDWMSQHGDAATHGNAGRRSQAPHLHRRCLLNGSRPIFNYERDEKANYVNEMKLHKKKTHRETAASFAYGCITAQMALIANPI